VKLTLVVAIALLAAPRLETERLPVRTLTTADGLPGDQLSCVSSDARGFMWFCTAEGLVRFDGRLAATFGRDEGLDPPGVRSFLRASDGRYWTGADAGLFEFLPAQSDRYHRFQAVRLDDGRPTGGVNALIESRDHAIWCAAGRGLFRLVSAPGRVHLTEVDIGLSRKSENDQIVRAVLEDERGALWVGAASGVYYRRPDGRTTRITTSDGLPVNEVRALALDSAGRLWAATREGLGLIDRDAVDRGVRPFVRHVYSTRDGLPATNIGSLYADGDSMWVGTVSGAAETSLTSVGDLVVSRRLIGFYATAIAGDAHGDVWIGTEAGVRRLTDRGFTTYLKEDGLAASRVSALFETRAGQMCATTLVVRLALSCFDGRRFIQMPIGALRSVTDPGWGWSQLTLQDANGRWWIPTGEGLWQFPAGPASSLASARPAAVYDVRRGLSSNNVFRLFEDSIGGIWVATFDENGDNGLARIDSTNGVLRRFRVSDGLPQDLPIVHAFAEDRTGSIWIGLETGRLLRYRAGRFDDVPVHDPGSGPVRPGASSEHLRSLLVDRTGRLWIASTVSGVGRMDDPQAASPNVKWLGMKQGLSSDLAWMLVEHASGALFIGTGRGVDRLNPVTDRITHYTADDGVPRGEIWGAVRDRQGQIWFATTDGAARLAVDDERLPAPPQTLVTAIRVAGMPLSIGADGATRVGAITVEPGDRRIEIEFVSPGAREADGLRYQHQLEGVDRDWTATDARTVALAGAAPGRYRFLVRAALASGAIGEPARVEFMVLAPIWRRGWFLAIVAGGAVAVAFGLHRLRVARLLEVERIRSRIAADLHDGIGASLSRIAILSEVVRSQAAPVLPAALPALTSIADNARDVIDDMSDVVWFIDPHLDNLQQLVVRVRAIASDLFDAQLIAWTLDVPDDLLAVALPPERRRHLYLMLKESLTNVRRHAHARHVAVRLAASGGRLLIEVVDDGIGVDARGPTSTGGDGRGLANMRARAVALSGTLVITSGPGGRGTRVALDIPAR
jgi:signal transduction histidine kinase/ligand-binding sensor domain-containing protein